MKVLLLLCSLLAAATAVPFQRNSIFGTAQGENSLHDVQQGELYGPVSNDPQQEQTFDAPYSDNEQVAGFDAPFTTNQEQPSFDASFAGVDEAVPAFGALVTDDQQTSDIDVQSTDQQQSSDAQFVGDQYSAFGESSDTATPDQSFPIIQPTPLNTASVVNPQSTAFGTSDSTGQQPAQTGLYAGDASLVTDPFSVVFDGDFEFYLRTALPFAGYRPTRYTSLDLSQVDVQRARNSGHKQYISVPDDDFSGEAEIYRLVGVAPSSAIRGGSAITYSANIGSTVPVYSELDDAYEHELLMQYMASRPRATGYSGGAQRQPFTVRAETTLVGNKFVVLLDD